MNRFLFIILGFSTSVVLLLGFRLTNIGVFSWLISGLCFLAVTSYLVFLRNRLQPKIEKYFRNVVYFIMGVVSFMIGLIVFRDLIFLPLSYFDGALEIVVYSTGSTLILMSCTLLLFAYGFWNASRGPRVVYVTVPIKNLPSEFEDFSIAQISDLHIGPGIDLKFVENVVRLTAELNPSVVVLTGDIADGSFRLHQSTATPLGQLSQKASVFFVTGNHEYYTDGPAWIEYFRKLGMTVLLNQHAVYPFNGRSILFAGVIDPAAGMVQPAKMGQAGPSIREAMAGAPTTDFKILLAHQPSIADEASPHFDLQISGHTHGGQFFPWNLIIGWFHRYSAGLMRAGAMWVYVNVGSGFWGPRLRLGTRSEISLIRFKKD